MLTITETRTNERRLRERTKLCGHHSTLLSILQERVGENHSAEVVEVLEVLRLSLFAIDVVLGIPSFWGFLLFESRNKIWGSVMYVRNKLRGQWSYSYVGLFGWLRRFSD
jgi:hypothetical protein